MANNITLSAGSADGAVIATDDIGGVHYQYNKIGIGADDTFTILTGGAGAVAGGTLRVTLASDDPGVVALQLLDNALYVDDADWTDNTSSHLLVGGLYQSTPQTVTDGDVAPFNITANGALHVAVQNTLTVASHAVTNAGTFAVQVDGNALTALQLIDDAIYAEDVAAQAADKGISVLAVRRDTASTMVGADNDYTNLIVDGSGRLHVNVGNTLTVASHAVTNAGTFAVQVDGAALTALQLIDDTVFAEDAQHTTADKGNYMLAVRDDSPAAHSGTDGDYESLHVNAEGGLWATLLPSASGGLTIFRSLDLDETEEEVKATAGCVYSIFAINTTNATLYLKLYNATAANVTVGTTTPVMTLPVPGNNDTDGAGFVFTVPQGIGFGTAITAAVTTAVADNDTGAPGANACIVQVLYK